MNLILGYKIFKNFQPLEVPIYTITGKYFFVKFFKWISIRELLLIFVTDIWVFGVGPYGGEQ